MCTEDSEEKERKKGEFSTREDLVNNVLTHFYRGEVQRANTWRVRLDETPNYAIVLTAALITWTFSSPQHTHLLLLLAGLIIFAFLYIESRRYRIYEVFRSRVQILEQNFLSQMLNPGCEINRDWVKMLAGDLSKPRHKVSLLHAISHRLHRVYIWLFMTIYITWILKIYLHPVVADSFSKMMERSGIGYISGRAVFMTVSGIIFLVVVLAFWGLKKEKQYMGKISERKPGSRWNVYSED